MNDDIEDQREQEEFLQLLLLEEDATQAIEDDAVYYAQMGAAVILYGAEEARHIRNERRYERRLYLTRAELLPNPRHDTPWQQLYGSRNDRAFITTMGFSCSVFDLILSAGFEERWNTTPISRNDVSSGGTPRLYTRSLDAAGALGLVLHYLNSTMHDVSLMQIFALIPTTVTRYISFSLSILLETLRTMDDARVAWPVGDEFQFLNSLVTACHPLLTGAFGVMDGLNLATQTSDDIEIENATYNGWMHDHFVSCVFSFGSTGMYSTNPFLLSLSRTGEIIACRLNAPGSWHDSRLAQTIYEKLRTQTPDGYYLVTDTAFPRGTHQIKGRIRAPMKSGTRLPADPKQCDQILAFDRQLLQFCQAAEWGMRTMQGSFGRLCVPLQINYHDLRGDLLETCTRLFNLRARKVGLNQIRTVYMPIWRENEQDHVWKDFEEMLFSEQRQLDRGECFHLVVVE